MIVPRYGEIEMINWRFGEIPEDGEAWLKNPTELYAYVDYRSPDEAGNGEWRRLMVVTKPWLDHHLAGVRQRGSEPVWLMIPTMLVLPDSQGEELRRIVNEVMQQGGFDTYSSPVAR